MDPVDEEQELSKPVISRNTMESRLRKLGILKLVPKKKPVPPTSTQDEEPEIAKDDSISPLYTKLVGKQTKSVMRAVSTRTGLGFKSVAKERAS